jgi:hypothetical protein
MGQRQRRPPRRLLHPLDGLQHPPEIGKVLDPSQQGEDDEGDDADSPHKQDDASLGPIGAGRKGAKAHNGEQKRPDEGGERVLRRRIFDQEACGAGRDGARRSGVGGHHGAHREGGDREHAGGEDFQDVVDRIRADLRAEVIRHERRQDARQQRQRHRKGREQSGPEPDAAPGQAQKPFPFGHLAS